MSCNTDKNYKLEAVSLTWGKEAVTSIAPAIGLVGGEYFTVSSPATDLYFHVTVNSSGADPAPAGFTKAGIVALPTSYTVANACDAIVTCLSSGKQFYVEKASDNLSVCLTNLVPAAAKSAPSMGTATGFVLTEENVGFNLDLGQVDKGVEISFKPTLFDIKANQTGTTINDQLIQGFEISVKAGLIQLSTAIWQKLIGAGFGNTLTPAAGTEVIGFGTAKNFTSSFLYAGRLVLHPVRLAANILTDDITIWKTIPVADSVNYSGTDLQTMPLTFTSLVDSNKNTKINIMVRGDSTQYMV